MREIQKRYDQSLQKYKQRLQKIPTQRDDAAGRTITPINLIDDSDFISRVLFPIRQVSEQEMDDAIYNTMTSLGHQKRNDKITKYLFSHLVDDYDILSDKTLSNEEKIDLIHLRNMIQRFLMIRSSDQKLDSERILALVYSLENPGDEYIPPLSKEKIINILHVIDYLLFKHSTLREIQKETRRKIQGHKQDFIDQIEYYPGYGIKYKQGFQRFQKNKQNL